MAKTQKRKININGIIYEWCLRGNHISPKSEHITIYRPDKSGQILYLDALPWGVEIRPAIIEDAISFALKKGWNPEQKGDSCRLGMIRQAFVVLPKGIKNSFEYETKILSTNDQTQKIPD